MMTDGRITLRPIETRDAAVIYHAVLESADNLAPWMPWYHAEYSLQDTRTWCKAAQRNWQEGLSFDFALMAATDKTFLGICGLNHINPDDGCANLGFWVRSSHTGKGIATTAALLVARFGFEELGLNRIEIVAARYNYISQRVAEKTGAIWEGVQRGRLKVREKIYDAVMFSLLPEDLAD